MKYCLSEHSPRDMQLISLLWVESPQRPITGNELPSWVPDWTTEQSLCAWSILAASTLGSAISYVAGDKNNALETIKRVGFSFEEDALVLSAVYIGVVTCVSTYNLQFASRNENQQMMKLFDYGQVQKELDESVTPEVHTQVRNIYNTSWGPFWVERGDITIISATCAIPIIIGRDGDSYLLVGGCWLIDSELQGVEKDKLLYDPGTSSIMRGSAWDETKVQTFRIR